MKTRQFIMTAFVAVLALTFFGCDSHKEATVGFSVSKEKQVIFSKGNLQYNPLTNAWRFAEKQWDYVGEANSNIADDYDGWLDLFGWGTGNCPTKVSADPLAFRIFVDWGTNQIGEDAANTWRTLSKEEWEYLLENRPHAKYLKGAAQVNGVNGLIILPDDWKTPKGVKFKSRFRREKSDDAYRSHQTLTAEQWSVFEQAGAIFLPAAVSRLGNVVDSIPTYAHYWTSTVVDRYSSHHFYLYPNEAGVGSCSRNVGMSVRLVKDVE